MSKLVWCRNKGCGAQFDPNDIVSDACTYHPGAPIFHDAKKKWSCCQKYSTDFTEFLNIKGCERGAHNAEEPKPNTTVTAKPVPIVSAAQSVLKTPPSQPPMPRPSKDDTLVPLHVNVAANLKAALESDAAAAAASIKTDPQEPFGDQCNGTVAISTPCHNSGCKSAYRGPSSNTEVCYYHPGAPVFHEGMKFWSCCQRKTTEFDSFMHQEGCTSGRHTWTQEAAAATNVMASAAFTECRFDWFQLPDTVTISVYAKKTLPDSVNIRCNGVFLSIDFVHDGAKSHFQKSFHLYGVIDPKMSQVNLSGTKVEINLKKAEPRSWAALELPTKQANVGSAANS